MSRNRKKAKREGLMSDVRSQKADFSHQTSENGIIAFKQDVQMVMQELERRYIVMRKTKENIEKMKRESLEAVHTHTHTQIVLVK